MPWMIDRLDLHRSLRGLVLLGVLALLLSACSDYGLVASDRRGPSPGDGTAQDEDEWDSDEDSGEGQEDPQDDADDSVPGDDDDDDDGGSEEEESGDDDDATEDDPAPDEQPGDSPELPRPAIHGDFVVNELMIDPESVPDAEGEYVELYNRSSSWLDASGLRLADDGVDDNPIQAAEDGDLVVGPQGFLVVCAFDDFWDNGGVDCDAVFDYDTFGGGFALSNTEDEVLLLSSSGAELDRVEYDASIVEVGAGIGVDPDFATPSGNDDLDEWCDQWGSLPFGDDGSPGETNDNCF